MEGHEDVVDAFITASRVLTGVAIRSIDTAEPPVTAPQHRLLVLLAAHGPQLVGDLATELGVNSSNATRHCDRLQRKGLLIRRRSAEDGRAVVVSLTPNGRSLVDSVTAVRRAEIRAVVDLIPPEDVAHTLAALESFSAAAGELPDGEWRDQSPGPVHS